MAFNFGPRDLYGRREAIRRRRTGSLFHFKFACWPLYPDGLVRRATHAGLGQVSQVSPPARLPAFPTAGPQQSSNRDLA